MKSIAKKARLDTSISKSNVSMNSKKCHGKRLQRNFFAQNCDILAKKLLGKVLCKIDAAPTDYHCSEISGTNNVLRARIVETEMYPGVTDPASHSFNGKKTSRNGAMFMDPGVSYVYNIYGMYQCKLWF